MAFADLDTEREQTKKQEAHLILYRDQLKEESIEVIKIRGIF